MIAAALIIADAVCYVNLKSLIHRLKCKKIRIAYLLASE